MTSHTFCTTLLSTIRNIAHCVQIRQPSYQQYNIWHTSRTILLSTIQHLAHTAHKLHNAPTKIKVNQYPLLWWQKQTQVDFSLINNCIKLTSACTKRLYHKPVACSVHTKAKKEYNNNNNNRYHFYSAILKLTAQARFSRSHSLKHTEKLFHPDISILQHLSLPLR